MNSQLAQDTAGTLKDQIVRLLTSSGRPLSPAEVAENVTSENDSYVRAELGRLVDAGLLTRPRRGLYAVKAADSAPSQDVGDVVVSTSGPSVPGLSLPENRVSGLKRTVSLTLYTAVCAGDGALIFDEASRITVEIPAGLAFHFFGFQPPPIMGVSEVVGDSMLPMFEPGDLVLYDLTPDVGGGGVFVINYDGKAACKRVQPMGRSYRLIPENRVYKDELIRLTESGYVHDLTGDFIEFGVVGRVLFPRPETPRLHVQQVGDLLRGMFREAAAGQFD